MAASMLSGIFLIALGISRKKHKGWAIILIALGTVILLLFQFIWDFLNKNWFANTG